MDLNDTPEQAAYREKARGWLEANKEHAPPLTGSYEDMVYIDARRDWQRHHRSSVQDTVHPTLQTIRHEVVAGRRTGGGELARRLVESAVERSLRRLCAAAAAITTGN